jgi:hypothetical protein
VAWRSVSWTAANGAWLNRCMHMSHLPCIVTGTLAKDGINQAALVIALMSPNMFQASWPLGAVKWEMAHRTNVQNCRYLNGSAAIEYPS